MRIEVTAAARKTIDAHAAAVTPMADWTAKTTAALWKNFGDVRATFASVSSVRVESGRTLFIFNVGGNRFRLVTAISYPAGIVVVHVLMTHATYDKDKWKGSL